jgi:hypothetical protein
MSASRLASAAFVSAATGVALWPARWVARPREHGLLLRTVGGLGAEMLGAACLLAIALLLVVLRIAPQRAPLVALAGTILGLLASTHIVFDVLTEPRLIVGPPAWLALAALLAASWLALLSIGDLGLRRGPSRAELDRAEARLVALAPQPAWEPILGDPYQDPYQDDRA